MRGKLDQAVSDEEEYKLRPLDNNDAGKRLDLNDLLKRIKNEERNNKKTNLLIFSGAITLIAAVLLMSLQ